MASQGRFAAVVLPAYLVLAVLLDRLPAWLAACMLALSAALLGIYSARFAAGYLVI